MPGLTTKPLELPTFADRGEVSRADLVFYGVDHSGPSYVGHVFLDRPRATLKTPRDSAHGYAGWYSVFGHGGCYGDEGHCAPDQRTVDVFDVRARHPLTPFTKTVIATDALQPLLLDPERTEIRVTVVVEARNEAEAKASARFEYVRLLTYEG
jgi:hypothetical protein